MTASHDAIFIAIIGLLSAMVASPVLIAVVQRYLHRHDLSRREMANRIVRELHELRKLLEGNRE